MAFNQTYVDMTFKASVALDYAMVKLLNALRDNIEQIVYGAGIPSTYDRSYEFLKSWETSMPIIKGNLIQSDLFQNILDMTFDADNFFHGSNYWRQEDVTPFLANIIFDGLSGDLMGEGFWRQARDAWTPTLELLTNGTFLRWFEESMMSQSASGSMFQITFK